jgi:iron complex outermembrane receptor protein
VGGNKNAKSKIIRRRQSNGDFGRNNQTCSPRLRALKEGNYKVYLSAHIATRHRKSALLCAILFSGASHFAYAADASSSGSSPADAPTSVGEVVVTAQRRSEVVSKVPASITAISAQTIDKFAITTFADYVKLAPNIAYGFGVGGLSGVTTARSAVIRGITGNNTTSFYIDDTPLPQSIDPRLFNLDHIEILRGPQGTLFGASSMGGTVRVITKDPSGDTISGNIAVNASKTKNAPGGGAQISGVVTAPLIKDQVIASASAYANYTPGYFKRTYNDPAALNVTGGTVNKVIVTGPASYVDNVGSTRENGATLAVRITPSALPDLKINTMAMWQYKHMSGFPIADYSQDNLVQRRILDVAENARDNFVFLALTGSYQTPIGRIVSSTSQFNRDTYDHEDGSDANVNAFKTFYASYPTGPYPIFEKASQAYGRTNIFTQELRFESNFDFPVQVIGGLFYQKTDMQNSGANIAHGFGAATGGKYSDNIFSSNQSTVTKQVAGFVGLTYKPIDKLELQAGVRYTKLDSHYESTSTGIYGVPGVTLRDSSGKPTTLRFSAKYNFTPTTMIYATAAQGFRLGGTNSPVTAACEGLIPYPTSKPIPYTSDELWSYEGGLKTKALNNRVSFSGSVYYVDWSKIQQYITIINAGCYAALTVNLGAAVSQGAEFETNIAVTHDLMVSMHVGFDDAQITNPGTASRFHEGQRLSSVPKWTGGLSADYEHPTSFGSYFVRGAYSFTGSSESYTQLVTGLTRKAYSTVDLRGGVNIGDYRISLYADNIFDKRTNLSDEAPVTSIVPGRYRYFVGPPRTIGVDLKYSF